MRYLAITVLLAILPSVASAQAQTSAFDAYRQQLAATQGPQQSSADFLSKFNLPGFENLLTSLKEQGLGALAGCDYQKYYNLANNLLEQGLAAFRPVDRGAEDPRRDWGIPFFDPIADFLRIGEVLETRKSSGAEAQSLAYQLEQVCNAIIQADEVNRISQIIKDGRRGVGNLLGWALDRASFKIDYGQGDVRVDADLANLYTNLTPQAQLASDSLWDGIHAVVVSSIEASNAMSSSLDLIEKELEIARRSLFQYAELSDGANPAYECSKEDFPNWSISSAQWETDPADGQYKPICGPATPERATQILAGLELRKTQLLTIQMSADAKLLEIEAMRLVADNLERQMGASVGLQTVQSGF